MLSITRRAAPDPEEAIAGLYRCAAGAGDQFIREKLHHPA